MSEKPKNPPWLDIDLNATGKVLGAYKSAAKKTGVTLEVWMTRRASGEKWCFRCRSWKKHEMFSIDRSRAGRKTSSCKACSSQASTASRYRMTISELAEFRNFHNHLCGICLTDKNLVIDHDHKTGKIRGLLCQNCNSAIGKFKESPEIMFKAIEYINNFQSVEQDTVSGDKTSANRPNRGVTPSS